VSLFNDRFGMHPLYFSEGKDGFYFACEAKAILAVRPELRQLDQIALGEFVACGSPLENRSLFLGISKLPPASLWIFEDAAIVKRGNYFQPEEWEEQEPLDFESYFQELHRVFAQNLPRYFAGKSKIGMSLTGGLDTRMVLACRETPPNSLPCYTFGSMFRENHDVRVARRVAEACRQSFQVIPAGTEFLSQFQKYAERTVFLTDGCVDTSRSPDLYLNEKVRSIAPVRMTGNYGGEVLRGVRAFKPEAMSAGLFQPDFQRQVDEGRENFVRVAKRHPVSFSVFQQGPWHHSGILGLEQTQVSMRSPFLDNEFVRTVFRSPRSAYSSSAISIRLIAEGNKSLAHIPTDRGFAGHRNALSRVLSRVLLETQFKAEYAYDMGMPQWLARADSLFSSFHFERLFLGRHKVFHFRIWYRTYLADYLQETLLDPRSLSRPYLERRRVEALVRAHVAGSGNFTNEIHKLLTLELLHRRFLEESNFSVPRGEIEISPAAVN
jgi:asparagine synthase (glutamine-hydrolysing)